MTATSRRSTLRGGKGFIEKPVFPVMKLDMITEEDKQAIERAARKYRVARVLLFGSSLDEGTDSQDIDIAVEGIADSDFYAFYGELLWTLSKPVDVVDLSQKSKFVEMIRREGIPLHA